MTPEMETQIRQTRAFWLEQAHNGPDWIKYRLRDKGTPEAAIQHVAMEMESNT